MSRVSAVDLPADSVLHQRRAPRDFLDCYAVSADMTPRQAANIITDFPGWAKFLVVIRGIITAPFGLDNEGPDAPDKVGLFPVEMDTKTELVAGFDDKHLDFRVSVMAQDGLVTLATWVSPHNIGGRLYLAAIMPFHIAIVRNALWRVAKATA
ncbi:MAG: DUF2867 domain-containing protein [Pseudomonadota bacterium]